MYTDNHLFFPANALASLRTARGVEWSLLIEHVCTLPHDHAEVLALVLTMVRLNRCDHCETDSFRAMRGCTACALQTLRRFKGSDAELLALYHQALADVQAFARLHPTLPVMLPAAALPRTVNVILG